MIQAYRQTAGLSGEAMGVIALKLCAFFEKSK